MVARTGARTTAVACPELPKEPNWFKGTSLSIPELGLPVAFRRGTSHRILSEQLDSAWTGLLGRVVFAGSCGSAAVKTKGRIALLENAEALQCAHLFRQVEAPAVLRDHYAAGYNKMRRA